MMQESFVETYKQKMMNWRGDCAETPAILPTQGKAFISRERNRCMPTDRPRCGDEPNVVAVPEQPTCIRIPGMDAQIQLGDRTLSYQLRRSPRRRTIAIAVDPQEGLVVYSPMRLNAEGLKEFLLEKANWILSNTDRLQAQRARAPEIAWESGGRILLRGSPIELRVEPGGTRASASLEGGVLVIRTLPEDGLLPEAQRVRAVVVKWLRGQATVDIDACVEKYLPLLDVRPRSVRVREQKRRWGSCSAGGALNFNWRLILAPAAVLNYVVVHELSHLKELNHSPRFWTWVGSLLPDYREPRAWLRQNSLLLDI
jgi:predicted metal-dependent hydrolase